jgi:hypothetical protein
MEMLQGLTVRQRVVMLFAGVGALAGAASALVSNGWLATLLMLALFYVTYKRAHQLLKVQPSELPRHLIWKSGFFPTVVCWLVAWIWVYTVLLML